MVIAENLGEPGRPIFAKLESIFLQILNTGDIDIVNLTDEQLQGMRECLISDSAIDRILDTKQMQAMITEPQQQRT
jgi:hypothetical protein